MVKAVIFDLDGTLLNTLNDLASSVNHALRICNYPERTIEEVRRFVGNGVVTLMHRSAPENISNEDFEKVFTTFKSYHLEHMLDMTVPYEGVNSLLEKLHNDGVKTAVVSNKLHSAVVSLCKDFFGEYISSAYGVEIEEERKPAPTNVLKALRDLGVSKAEAVYIGDSEVDVQTAENSGLPCIGVSWGFRDKGELLKCGCESVIDDCEALYNELKNNY